MKIQKYFLLHNKKLKPWIKYWLYIKSKDKNYVLSDILDGTSFYLENSSNKNFNLFQINGNTTQDGTPTPTNPVEIENAGEGYINVTISNSNNTQSQNFTIPCQQPMRSIGEIRDEFVKQDGVWYEKHNLRERILVGNENWISQAQSGFYRYGLADSVINNETSYASQVIIKSDSFKGITFNNRNSDTNETIYAVSNAQQHNLFINTKSYTTLNDFKNWLTGNNIKLIYLLNEPNYIECTQEQVQVLESITQAHTYKHITNINSTDITPAFLKIQYYMEV